MKHFNFKLYIHTNQGQKFLIKSFGIDAKTQDEALKKFNLMDLPFHHFNKMIEK